MSKKNLCGKLLPIRASRVDPAVPKFAGSVTDGGCGIGIQHQFAQPGVCYVMLFDEGPFLGKGGIFQCHICQKCRQNFTPAMDDLQAGIPFAVPGLASSSHSS